MSERIKEVFDYINEHLKMHNGSCELLGVEDGVATIRLHGGCAGCPSSQMTLYGAIKPILQERVPEIKDVILG